MTKAEIVIILPAKNEAKGIGAVIDEIYSLALRTKVDVLVVEHGSTDATVAVAESSGARVITCYLPGKGCGVRWALDQINGQYKYIFMMDADYTYPAIYLLPMLRALKNGADVVAGVRTRFAPGAISFSHYVWGRLAATWVSVIYQRRVKDALTGMWGFKASAIPDLKLTGKSFELEVDIWGGALRAGNLTICQVPIEYRPRLGDVSKPRVMDVFPILGHALKRRFTK